jgi:hypothetical protein
MMLVLSSYDFQKLSPTCRSELMRLLLNDRGVVDAAFFSESNEGEGNIETEEVVNEEKKVVSLTVVEARDLLGNISERSRETLKHFALGQPVPLVDLVGQDKPYKNYIELKRSFVGAVNRRLRTVSGNRNAALFSSDRDQTLIKVKPKTAQSLRRIFAMHEPMPFIEFCDQQGQEIAPSHPQCQPLAQKLEEAWKQIDSNKLPEDSVECFAAVLLHLVDRGFELYVRSLKNWDQDTDTPGYEIHTVIDPLTVIENRRNEHGLVELFVGLPDDSSTLAQPKI